MCKKILVLGGHGFMGKNIQDVFKNSQHTLFYESRRTGFDLDNFSITCEKLNDIKPDIIIYAAAHVGSIGYVSKFSADIINDNAQMYLNLYKAVATVNPGIIIVNPISNCSYPGIIDIQDESKWWDGVIHESVESFGSTKKLGFTLSECYRKQHGIKTINLIISNAYGPNDYIDENRTHAMNGIIMRMIKSQNNNETDFLIWGTGSPIREWVYMPDVARLMKNIIDDEIYNLPNPINIGQESGVSILESVKTTKKLLNYEVELLFDTTKQDGAPVKILGRALFNQYFPDFKFTKISDGIENTIKYYKNIID